MKKLITSTILLMVLLFATSAFAAAVGTVTQTAVKTYIASGLKTFSFICTGASDSGSIPNTASNTANTAAIEGYQLFQVDAFPTSGGTAPDAADVLILDANGKDLLGSVDGSTAYGGLNLIHATLAKSTIPDIYLTGTTAHAFYSPYVTSALTLKVNNQATNSANYTVRLWFKKDR